MAQKSKTQRAKASAARQARKAEKEAEELVESVEAEPVEEKKSLFKKKEAAPAPQPEKKAVAKPKKKRFKFLHEVKTEMKRVTWPTRKDVTRWSLVVVGALLFFGVYVAVLDSAITPLLVLVSGIGA